MRTLDIIEIDMVAGGTRTSIGAHPLSSSIHHAKAHKKTHHAKAKTHHHHHMAMHKTATAQMAISDEIAPVESRAVARAVKAVKVVREAKAVKVAKAVRATVVRATVVTVMVTAATATVATVMAAMATVRGSNDKPATSASASGTTVTYTAADGTTQEVTGTHPNRDNNPLDIRSGTFADNHGTLGDDRGFAIFSSPQAGLDAAAANMDRLNNNAGGTATLSDLITSWSPPSENPTSEMITTITTNSGLNPSDQWSSLSSDQRNAFITAYGHREGWHGN